MNLAVIIFNEVYEKPIIIHASSQFHRMELFHYGKIETILGNTVASRYVHVFCVK